MHCLCLALFAHFHKVQILAQRQSLSALDEMPLVLCINQISALQVLALGLKVKHGPAAGANNIHYQFNIVDPIRLFICAVSTRRARSQPTDRRQQARIQEAIGRYDFSPKCGKKRQIITLTESAGEISTVVWQGGNNVNFIAFNTPENRISLLEIDCAEREPMMKLNNWSLRFASCNLNLSTHW